MTKAIPLADENPDGLHYRYAIAKADGSPCDPRGIYFVLRLDSYGGDQDHIEACRTAAMAYAARARSYPHLAKIGAELLDLIRILDNQPLGERRDLPPDPD